MAHTLSQLGRDMMSQVHDFRLEKQALQRLKLQIELPEPLEQDAEALQVFLLHAAKDYDVVQVNHAVCDVQLPQSVTSWVHYTTRTAYR